MPEESEIQNQQVPVAPVEASQDTISNLNTLTDYLTPQAILERDASQAAVKIATTDSDKAPKD